MGNLYQQALVLQGKDKALIGDQRRWIADRDSKCKAVPAAETRSCVLDMTKARLATLAGDVAASPHTADTAQSPVTAQAKPHPQPEAKTQAKLEARSAAKVETKPEAKVWPEAKPEAKSQTWSEAKLEIKPEAKSKTKSEAKPKAKWETEPEAKSDDKTEAAAAPKLEAKPESKIAAKPEPKSKSKPESSREAKSEPKSEPKLETKREAKLETKLEAKTKAKPEAKTDASLAKDLDCSDTINAAACRESKRIQAKIDRDCARPTKWGEPAKSADCKAALAAKEKERDGFRRILHAEDKDPQYASITTGMADRQPVEEVDQETKLENADKKLGYATISPDDFTRNGNDLVTSQKKISLVGTYLKMGNSERFYMSRLTAMLVKTGNSTDPGIPLMTDQAPEELRTYLLKCSGFAANVEMGCSARIRGRVTRCKQGAAEEMPCLVVEGGSALPE